MVATQCTWWLPDGTQSHGIMSSLFTSCHKYQQWKEWYHYYSATIRWRSLLLRQQRRDSWLTTSYHSQLTQCGDMDTQWRSCHVTITHHSFWLRPLRLRHCSTAILSRHSLSWLSRRSDRSLYFRCDLLWVNIPILDWQERHRRHTTRHLGSTMSLPSALWT